MIIHLNPSQVNGWINDYFLYLKAIVNTKKTFKSIIALTAPINIVKQLSDCAIRYTFHITWPALLSLEQNLLRLYQSRS